MMIALSSEPEETRVALNPRARDNIATKNADGARDAHDRDNRRAPPRFHAAKVVNHGMAMSDPPQRIHNAHSHRADAREKSTRDADRDGQHNAEPQRRG